MAKLRQPSDPSLPRCMKPLLLLVCTLVVASCNNADPFYGTGPASTTTATTLDLGPPVFGSPAFVSSQIGNGPPYARSGFYPYSSSRPGGMATMIASHRLGVPLTTFTMIWSSRIQRPEHL